MSDDDYIHAYDVLRQLDKLFPCKVSIKLTGGNGNGEQVAWTKYRLGSDILEIDSFKGGKRWCLWPIARALSGHDWAYFASEFYFNDESDAVLFKLRWG